MQIKSESQRARELGLCLTLTSPRYQALDALTVKVPGMKFYTKERMLGLFRHVPEPTQSLIRQWPED